MLEEKVKLAFYALVIPVIFLLGGILSCAIDYALNKTLIDLITADTVQWWHFFTFDHFMTWLYVYQSSTFAGIYIALAIGMYVAAFIILRYALR